MTLFQSSRNILGQLIDTVEQMDAVSYSSPLPILFGSSIGMHVRHIVEFYQCLLSGLDAELINYDARKRNPDLENDPSFACQFMQQCMAQLEDIVTPLTSLQLIFSTSPDNQIQMPTSLDRELAYNIEHAIHHMTIIKMALTQCFPQIPLPRHFGVAYATQRYQQDIGIRSGNNYSPA